MPVGYRHPLEIATVMIKERIKYIMSIIPIDIIYHFGENYRIKGCLLL